MVKPSTKNQLVENGRVTRSRLKRNRIQADSTNNAPAVTGKADVGTTVRIDVVMKRRRDSHSGNAQESERMCRPEDGSPKRRTSTIPAATAGPSAESDADDAEICQIVRQLVKIRDILGKDYLDVAGRLKLDIVPYCVQNQSFCKTHHHKKCPRPKIVDRLHSVIGPFSKQNRRLHYLKSVQDMCARMEFPGDEVITNLVDMILIAKQSSIGEYSSEYLLQNCVLVTETILMKFPPCWPDINEAYHKVLMANIDVKRYFPKQLGIKPNILLFVLDILADTIASVDEAENRNNRNLDDSDSFDGEIVGYSSWLQRNSTEENFTLHTRTEKLDRLFLVLHLLTKILEHDFSIWMLRYPSKPEQAMFTNTSPLIARVFFDGTYRQITAPVKKLLEIFVISVCNAYPKDKVDILSRIVALLSVAINLCEKQSAAEIRYPFIQIKAVQFAKEIFKTIENKYGRKISNFLAVIKSIRVPFIKYLVIEQLLYKMNPDQGEMCIKKIFNNFEKKRWEQCEEGLRSPDEIPTPTKYPISPAKILKRPKCSSIYRNEYLDILLDALRAYCETHCVRDVVYQVFANKTVKSTPSPPPPPNMPLRAMKLASMEQDIAILERQLNRKRSIVQYKFEEIPYGHIHVDRETMKMYRNDVKYLGLLLKLIRDLRKKNETIFDEWYTFLDTILSI